MDPDDLTEEFEAARSHLRSVAFHLLGSVEDADDAVQAAWLKADRADRRAIDNPTGWLTTITVHESLDQLRARRRAGSLVGALARADLQHGSWAPAADEDVLRADAVDRALLVVLDRLSPAQRVAFVLHDVFAMPFDEIAAVLDRSPDAAKKLASRARRRLHDGPSAAESPDRERTERHVRIVEAFLVASRDGDLRTLMHLLAPDVVRRVDRNLVPDAIATEVRGDRDVAEETRLFAVRARSAAVVLLDGEPAIAIAPRGRLRALMLLAIGADGRIHEIEIIGDPARLRAGALAVPR
ncbi:sigma-70 family RNA polymerase sigma factor [Nocardioides sp. YIM 152315]|uniref:sigma-70 family RNA polymerase sigma factor n=1 Tax=Nocardioides sp. YIM 152315 TaxID=3031760 RepID=UPI0023DCCD3B|nr:sigma-70 family RNA polymerase sigma factor [Nocardioides sp. YIM 152315]MDF1602774.1 sigma-70 family RNA polymerase sigma factor [Nocardioides sp. YIM 152315]